MYIEKILYLKSGQSSTLEKGCAEDLTANQKCRIKVRAVGLDFEIAKWLMK